MTATGAIHLTIVDPFRAVPAHDVHSSDASLFQFYRDGDNDVEDAEFSSSSWMRKSSTWRQFASAARSNSTVSVLESSASVRSTVSSAFRALERSSVSSSVGAQRRVGIERLKTPNGSASPHRNENEPPSVDQTLPDASAVLPDSSAIVSRDATNDAVGETSHRGSDDDYDEEESHIQRQQREALERTERLLAAYKRERSAMLDVANTGSSYASAERHRPLVVVDDAPSNARTVITDSSHAPGELAVSNSANSSRPPPSASDEQTKIPETENPTATRNGDDPLLKHMESDWGRERLAQLREADRAISKEENDLRIAVTSTVIESVAMRRVSDGLKQIAAHAPDDAVAQKILQLLSGGNHISV